MESYYPVNKNYLINRIICLMIKSSMEKRLSGESGG
jgi:hypothetical protein